MSVQNTSYIFRLCNKRNDSETKVNIPEGSLEIDDGKWLSSIVKLAMWRRIVIRTIELSEEIKNDLIKQSVQLERFTLQSTSKSVNDFALATFTKFFVEILTDHIEITRDNKNNCATVILNKRQWANHVTIAQIWGDINGSGHIDLRFELKDAKNAEDAKAAEEMIQLIAHCKKREDIDHIWAFSIPF